jgi:Holliday junction DNA helicase RuvA
MFAFLRGTVARKGSGVIDLDVNGVGYEVCVADSVSSKLVVNQEITLQTYCHIREDAFQIFGFFRDEDKALFKTLLGVSGIGPKVSLAILSAMSASQFAKAIMENDVTAFTRVGGVGKKTAQRVVLEMKAKLGQNAELDAILGEPEDKSDADSDDVIAALCSLGCSLAEARKAATAARKQAGDDAPVEEIIRLALRSLSKV